ncbi:hypothetical protein C4J65_30190 [Streptomyces sp. CB09001]|uniref:hypothetical protein n=1 Tax=Streptomyces sp. CB09001 TaxID=2083284 RepID=UPI000E212306|nr:hypothetical protein [Streptomyces sp. CB09001]AXL92087.1 hypothetical protein C4J65_30190 [Streptomyces sp. CB09001]
MIDSTPTRRDGSTPVPPATVPSPSAVRAERRQLIESIRALRRLLDKGPAFEVSDQQRLNREARDRNRAEAVHGIALQRIHKRQARQEASLNQQLNGLDGKRESQETRALAVLRRESIERTLSRTYLTSSEVNGIGKGLIRDLAAHGIRTAADFERVTWEKAPNGKGGDVLYIHRTKGGKVHINGIGQHRGRPLLEWRQSVLARAESRAPRLLPPDERHRIAEIIDAERSRLRKELAEAPRAADKACKEATQLQAEVLSRLTTAEEEASRLAAVRRAEFDAMAEKLLDLQAQLSAHMDTYGDIGRRLRRAQHRALRPLPQAPPLSNIPSPRTAGDAPALVSLTKVTDRTSEPHPTPGTRAHPSWLVPILYFTLTTVVGVGELGGNTASLSLMITSRLVAFAATAELLRLWVPRIRRRTASPMPSGTGWQTSGVFLGLTAAGMFADEHSDVFRAACVVSILAGLCLLAGTGLRIGKDTTTSP